MISTVTANGSGQARGRHEGERPGKGRGERPGRGRGRRAPLAALLACSLLSGCAALVTPNFETELSALRDGDYTLDPDHAYLLFKVGHLGLSKVVGRFNRVDATLDFDPDDLAAMSLEGQVAVASIDLDDESLEQRLLGPDWLDAARFAEARFVSTSVVAAPDGQLLVTGDFTLRGITQELQLRARFGGGADNLLTGRYTLGFEAEGELSRSAYGIDGFAALVGDAIEIEIHAEFQRAP